jgi:colanic acid/amylovoran biosynthesis glycosyltransferase
MKIGIVLSNTPAYSETFFISKIKGLQKKGFEVVLIVGKHQSNFNFCPVLVQPKINTFYFIITLLKTFWFSITSCSVLKRFIQLERRSGNSRKSILKKIIVNLHILKIRKLDWLHFGFATQAIGRENIASAIGAKMAVSLRGFDINVYPLKHKESYELLWKKVDKVHSISNYLLSEAYRLGLNETVDYKIITPAVKIMNASIHEKNALIKITTIGRLHWIKNYSDILKSLKLLKDKNINFSYHIIGEGNLMEELKYQVYEYGLDTCIIFEGKLSHQETLNLLKLSDLYIQYSYSEGFCNAVLEAQSLGIPAIVSNGGALSENVIHTKTGWVVEKNNPKLLAQKIEEVLSLSDAKKQEMRNTAIERVRKDFNIEKQENEFINFYTN